jgi:hypothetical protein
MAISAQSVRVGAVAFALIVYVFAQPSITTAARRASAAPPEARIRVLRGDTLSEFMSGVDLMRDYAVQQFESRADIRLLMLGVLVWLACAPAFRQQRALKQGLPPT